jgi:hypothetical protein
VVTEVIIDRIFHMVFTAGVSMDRQLNTLKKDNREVGHRLRNVEMQLDPLQKLMEQMMEQSQPGGQQHG